MEQIGQQHPDWLQFLGTLESSSKKVYSGVMDSFIVEYSQAINTAKRWLVESNEGGTVLIIIV